MAARHKNMSKAASSGVMAKPKPGGEAPIAIPGVAVMHESKKGSEGFKKGGGVPAGLAAWQASHKSKGKKDGGTASGDCAPGDRMDKMPRKARGGAATMRGRSPLSAASSTSMPGRGTTH